MDAAQMKRVPSLVADGPDSKKQRAALVDPLVARREIVQVYNAYDVLLAGCEDPRPMLDVLVRAGQEGCIPAKRLAARLLPRFVAMQPATLRPIVETILGLTRLEMIDDTSRQTKCEALSSLPAVALPFLCSHAIRSEPEALRCTVDTVHAAFQQLGALVEQNSMLDFPTAAEEWWDVLSTAFWQHPRLVLAACLPALKSASGGACRTAKALLKDYLLTNGGAKKKTAEALETLPQSDLVLMASQLENAAQELSDEESAALLTSLAELVPGSNAARFREEREVQLANSNSNVAVNVNGAAASPAEQKADQSSVSLAGVGLPPLPEEAPPLPSSSPPITQGGPCTTGVAGDGGWSEVVDVDQHDGTKAEQALEAENPPLPPSPPPLPQHEGKEAKVQKNHQSTFVHQSPSRAPVGGDPCLAGPALLARNLPPTLVPRALHAEASRHAHVDQVAGASLSGAFIVRFPTIRDALRCFEAMAEQPAFDPVKCVSLSWNVGTQVLLSTDSDDSNPRGRGRARRPLSHVWVPGPSVEDERLRRGDTSTLLGQGAPPCEYALRVGGRVPGVLLAFDNPRDAARTLEILHPDGSNPNLSDFRCPNNSAPPRPVTPPSPASSAEAGELVDETVLASWEAESGGEGAPCTLWVTGIPPRVPPTELLHVFGNYGRLLGHKYMRGRGCAYIDFATRTDAARARTGWNGRWLPGQERTGSPLSVEFKGAGGPSRFPPRIGSDMPPSRRITSSDSMGHQFRRGGRR